MCAAARLRGLASSLRLALPSLRCGLPVVALAAPRARLCASLLGRPPLGPPASRLRGRGAPAPGAGGPAGRLSAPRPGRLVPLSRPFRRCGVLPCAPPPRRPRWGLRGARGLLGRGPAGPRRGAAFSSPFPAAPPGYAGARCGIFSRLTVRKLSTRVFRPPPCLPFSQPRQGFPSARCLGLVAQARGLDPAGVGFSAAGGLTFPARCAILFVRGLLAAPPGAALLGVQGAG